MKRELYYWALGLGALACIVLNGLGVTLSGGIPVVMALPFDLVGTGLRALSASSPTGNVVAFVLYILLGALPIAGFVVIARRRRLRAEDLLLIPLSAALYGILYLFINPGYIGTLLGTVSLIPAAAKALVGTVPYSFGIGYLALRALRAFTSSDTAKLMRYLMVMLGLVGVGLVYVIAGSRLGKLMVALGRPIADGVPRPDGTWIQNQPGWQASLLLTYAVDILPLVLAFALVIESLELVRRLRRDRFSAETVARVGRVSRLCVGAVAAIVVTTAAYNVIQVFVARGTTDISASVYVPVVALAFVLTTLILTRLAAADRRLKADNDMII